MFGTIYQERSAAASQIQSERQSSYIAYEFAMDRFDGDITGVLLTAKLGFAPTRYVNKVIRSMSPLEHAADQVIIIGSSRLVSIVHEQQKRAETLDFECQQLQSRMTYPKASISSAILSQPALMKKVSSGDTAFARTEKSYEYVARTDLGTG